MVVMVPFSTTGPPAFGSESGGLRGSGGAGGAGMSTTLCPFIAKAPPLVAPFVGSTVTKPPKIALTPYLISHLNEILRKAVNLANDIKDLTKKATGNYTKGKRDKREERDARPGRRA